ncbi:hypothetical protein PLESTF_000532300 [Pleodorina starrii]|nr:hypothetical protein PLESTF_000532300 [Pleodorina starrii]
MEFDFTSLAFGGEQHIVAWDSKRIGALKSEDQQNLSKLLDVFGKKSAVAQGLQTPVTDIHRLRTTDQRLYLYMYRQSSKTVVLGGLKVGTKRLYLRTVSADLKEVQPVCVLDFYVHESCQRKGVGKALFEHFLSTEGCDPGCLAYDRPSPKLLAFLRKHYGLQEYVPQSNNYVVFNRYWELNPTAAAPCGSRGQGRLNSRGSVASSGGTPYHVHPLHGPRSTPLPGTPPSPLLAPQPLLPPPAAGAPVPVHPAWAGVGSLSAPSPSLVVPPQPLGNSPSFGQRWAASNFGPGAGPQDVNGGGCDGEAGSYGHSHGDSLDAFSRSHGNPSSCPPDPGYQPQPVGRQPAPWEGPGLPSSAGPMGQLGAMPGGAPPASRGGYNSRPPWAVDDSPPGGAMASSSGRGAAVPPSMYGGGPAARSPHPMERLGTGASSSAARGPLQTILSGGGGRDGGGGGPHTRALQQQVAALQFADATEVGGSLGGLEPRQTAAPPSRQQQWGLSGTPATGGGAEESGGGARAAARIMAVAQRSGAGAADCLVW